VRRRTAALRRTGVQTLRVDDQAFLAAGTILAGMSLRLLGRGVLLALVLHVASIAAQARTVSEEPQWRCMEVWRQPQGLPQNTVYSLAQTGDGYIWIGTKSGAARFDGVRFTSFDDTHPNQIKENEVWNLLEDAEGALWMATYGGGAARLKDGRFTLFTTAEGLLSDYVATIGKDKSGALWIGSDAGVSVLRNGRPFAQYTVKEGLAQKAVRSFFEDEDGSMWVGGLLGGINRIQDGKVLPVSLPEIKATAEVRRFVRDRDGTLWIATTEGLIEWRRDQPARLLTTADGLTSNRLYTVYEDPLGNLWIGSDKGLDRREGQGFVSVALGNEVARLEEIDSLTMDKEGSLWAGSQRDGLARLKQGLFISYTAAEGLADNYTATVFEDSHRRMWIGTARGLNLLTAGTLRTLTIPGASNRINSLAEDPEGRVWVGTNDAVYRLQLDCDTCEATFIPLKRDVPGGLFVRVLYFDPEGALWIGSNLDGLFKYQAGQWTAYTTANGLSGNAIRGLVRDKEGSLWIGVRGGGLNRLKDGAFTVYREKDGLANDNVQSLFMDRTGTLWVSTRQGVTALRNGRYTTYRVRDGLFSNYVYAFADDELGNLWMSCSKGIFRVPLQELADFADGKRKTITSTAYGLEHGLASTVAIISQYPSGFTTRDGHVWFATFKGATVIDPKRIVRNPLPPPVHIEEVVANGSVLSAGDARVAPGRGDLTFRFTALSFLAPEKMAFRYKLEGYDADWVNAGTRRVAYYTNIPPGRYRFRVAASNNDGVWNEEGASSPIVLVPHFYQTYAFYGACLLAVGMLGAATQRLRVRLLKAREAALEVRVEEMFAQMKVMRGLLPICASCKKIRDDGGYWNQIETYIQSHTQAEFSHSVCPECLAKLYPDYHAEMEKQRSG
jgi:ligand-binding sensor domain-containing protein